MMFIPSAPLAQNHMLQAVHSLATSKLFSLFVTQNDGGKGKCPVFAKSTAETNAGSTFSSLQNGCVKPQVLCPPKVAANSKAVFNFLFSKKVCVQRSGFCPPKAAWKNENGYAVFFRSKSRVAKAEIVHLKSVVKNKELFSCRCKRCGK